jgi:hypothetical protein
MQRDEKLAPGLLLLYPDLEFWCDVRLRHSDYIGAALTQIEEKVKRRARLGAERPAFFELLNSSSVHNLIFLIFGRLMLNDGSCFSHPMLIAWWIRIRSFFRVSSAAPGRSA